MGTSEISQTFPVMPARRPEESDAPLGRRRQQSDLEAALAGTFGRAGAIPAAYCTRREAASFAPKRLGVLERRSQPAVRTRAPGDTRGPVAWSTGKSMRCQNCSAENPQGAKFCIQCATPFQHRCQKCGFENPPEARFCAQCAAPLDAAAPIRAESEASDGLTGERRHLTVLFLRSRRLDRDRQPSRSRAVAGDRRRVPSRGGAGHRALRRACRAVPWRRRDGLLRLARGARQRRRACRARGPRDPRRNNRNSTSTPRTQSSPRGSGSIQARWWWAQVRAKTPTYSATRPISPRECRRPPIQARC